MRKEPDVSLIKNGVSGSFQNVKSNHCVNFCIFAFRWDLAANSNKSKTLDVFILCLRRRNRQKTLNGGRKDRGSTWNSSHTFSNIERVNNVGVGIAVNVGHILLKTFRGDLYEK